MGIVTPGIPQEIVLELARELGVGVFVETGTFHGNTTRWAAKHFSIVHTIERAKGLFDEHHKELARLGGVNPHFGDSRQILPKIVSALRPSQRALYWLDGHWSGGETAGEGDECPLLDELACLVDRNEDVILIDDARLFLCAPPKPHAASQWPTIVDILDLLRGREPFVQIVDDVIFVVPRQGAARDCLITYAQKRAEDTWRRFTNT